MTGPYSADSKNTLYKSVIIIITIISILYICVSSITDKLIKGDSGQNLNAAFNIFKYNTYSSNIGSSTQNITPSLDREPFPPFVLSGYMKILDSIVGNIERDDVLSGNLVTLLKYSNAAWAIFLAVITFVAVLKMSRSYIAAALTSVWAVYHLHNHLDRFYTEIQSAALLVLSSLLLYYGVRTQRVWVFFLCGLSFGMLALTKAAFLYVFLAVSAALLMYWLNKRFILAISGSSLLSGFIVMLIGASIIVGPWMARSYVHFGGTEINLRGGLIPMIRATQNQMTWDEYRGAIWQWAPDTIYIRSGLGRVLGYSSADLELEGRLQRLNRNRHASFNQSDRAAINAGKPEDAVNYYKKSKAYLQKRVMEFREARHPFPRLAAERQLKSEAIQMVLANPLKHLAMTPLYLWRGAPFTFPILAAFALFAALRRREDYFFFVLPALCGALLYGFATHNLPRYSEPMDIVAGICLVVSIVFILRRLARRFTHLRPSPADQTKAAEGSP